ncbi:transposase [Hymenobacter sp. BT186]|uniref:Transposase n=1 Tax=Hymenobacter telluris TaxID=2816474 RepID=A0A939F0D8_9BACT|nr:transposase [Hymenobacter telluris]MBW3376854.1 transposase [Hymenobacter norwichensis]
MFFKLLLVRRLENRVSDRPLVEPCALRLDILYFLGYEVNEYLPWHFTISRTRQLYPLEVLKRLFDHVFAQCVVQDLVADSTQAVDSAPVKANGSLYSSARSNLWKQSSRGCSWRGSRIRKLRPSLWRPS